MLALILLGAVVCLSPADAGGQYHIQTDEGPERFFRYQTSNGQYRKEKRLADGTVIGTEGWLDPLGYFRLKDYIADADGFRILKSTMVHVGKGRPIDDAVAEARRVPSRKPSIPFRGNEIRPEPKPQLPTYEVQPFYPPRPYDGTYSTPNGFEYYLKRQYHQEQQHQQQQQSNTGNGVVGSFGYVDPFGIRRVIYYKTDPATGGFLHQKKNKYVGLDGSPYDPTFSNLYKRDVKKVP